MKITQIFLGLLCSSLLLACSKSADNFPVDPMPDREFEDLMTLENYVSAAGASCPDMNCSPSATALFTLDRDRYAISGCSGTLVGPRLVLTNRHCLPGMLEYSESGDSCEGSIYFVFPRLPNYPAQKAGCKRIVGRAERSSHVSAPDWALLELSHDVDRPYVEHESQPTGIEPESRLTLYPVYFELYETEPEKMAVLREVHCLANTNNIASLSNMGALSPLFDLSECTDRIQGGNSGTGVLSDEGIFKGVLSWTFPIEDSNSENMRDMRRSHPTMRQRMGGGTNAACIPWTSTRRLPEYCSFDESILIGRYTRAAAVYNAIMRLGAYTEIDSQRQEFIERVSSDPTQAVRWTDDVETIRENFGVPAETRREMDSRYQSYWASVIMNRFVEVHYPVIPECVPVSEGNPIAQVVISLPYRESSEDLEDIIEEGTWRVVSPTLASEKLVSLERQGDLFVGDVQEDLQLRVPICE